MEPLKEDERIHESEETEEDDEANDDFKDKVWPSLEIDRVASLNKDTHRHMDNTHNNGKLHLDTVSVGETFATEAPHWIVTNWVVAVGGQSFVVPFTSNVVGLELIVVIIEALLDCWSFLISFLEIVAGAKKIGWDGEPLVVDQTAVS